MADQNLTLHAKADGFDQAAAQVAKVTEKQYELARSILTSSKATAQDKVIAHEQIRLYEQQEAGLNKQAVATKASAVEFGALREKLVAVHPALGAVLESLNGFKNVGSVIAAAIIGISNAFAEMAEQARRVTEEITRQREALNKLKDAAVDRQQAIENASDARKSGGFDAKTSAAAFKAAESIGKKFGALDPEAVNTAVGTLYDTGASEDDLAKAAFLVQSGKLTFHADGDKRRSQKAFERSLRKNQDAVGGFFGRESAQRKDVAAEAQTASLTVGSPTSAIRDFISGLPGQIGKTTDPELLARTVQGRLAIEGLTVGDIDPTNPGSLKAAIRLPFNAAVDGSGQQADLEFRQQLLKEREGIDASPAVIREAEFVIQQLKKQSQSGGQPQTIIYNQQNARNVGADAAAQARRTRNGENNNGQY